MDLIHEVEALRAVVEELAAAVRKRHVKRLRKGKCTIELGFLLSDIVTGYERIAVHCVHIATGIVQVRDDSLEMHNYNREIRAGNMEGYKDLYEKYTEEYTLP